MTYVPKPTPPQPEVTLLQLVDLLSAAVTEDVFAVPLQKRTAMMKIIEKLPSFFADTNVVMAVQAAGRIKSEYEDAIVELAKIREERHIGRMLAPEDPNAVDLKTVALSWARRRWC